MPYKLEQAEDHEPVEMDVHELDSCNLNGVSCLRCDSTCLWPEDMAPVAGPDVLFMLKHDHEHMIMSWQQYMHVHARMLSIQACRPAA